ncbi:MAG TPA: CoA transferase [Candidatus Eisenbacteria bacterium]|nr:CoA transferase [Candidatus Eisenbacteria bacterium]
MSQTAFVAHRPLEGIVVLDLSRVLAGPYATMLLGDLGAEVWKVERPGIGDETRAWGPPFVGNQSAYYLSVNRNKRSAELDFRNPRDLEAVKRAAMAADVVVENYLPGTLVPFGLDAGSLRKAKPELVVCSITGFGQDGPYAELPGYDAVLQGFIGLQSITGQEEGPPTKVGVALVDVLSGAHAAAAILGSLVGQARGRGGAHIDLALFEVGVHAMVNVSQGVLTTGKPARRHGNAHPHIVPYQTFEAADGLMVLAVGNDEQWRRVCQALGDPERGDDPRFAKNPARVLHKSDVVAWLASRFAEAPRAHWLERFRAARVPAGAVREVHEVVRDPALEARGMIAPRIKVAGGETDLFQMPWRIDEVRPPLRLPPPALGEHTAEFWKRFVP